MSDYVWCHGPNCHTYHTVDRVRGSKGSKVLRTRKIKQQEWNQHRFDRFFCSNSCYNDFANKHVEQIVKIAPRTTPLETRIADPKKETHRSAYGDYTYTTTTIRELDNDNNVG